MTCPKSSAYQARTLVVELPARNQELHGGGVVPRASSNRFVELIGLLHLRHIELNAEAAFFRYFQFAVLDAEWLFGEPLSILPDPVRVDCGYLAGRGGPHVREHRE